MGRKIFCLFFFRFGKRFFSIFRVIFQRKEAPSFFELSSDLQKKAHENAIQPSFANRHSRMTRLSENRDSFNKKFDSEFDLKAAAKMRNTSCLKLNEAFFFKF